MVTEIALERPLTDKDLDEIPDEGNRYGLIWGELYVSPTPSIRHQVVYSNLLRALTEYLVQHSGSLALSASVGVHLDSANVVQPDFVVYEKYDNNLVSQKEFKTALYLAVEILSPSNRAQDLIKSKCSVRILVCPNIGSSTLRKSRSSCSSSMES